jgi:hypothetical protein
MLLLLLMMGTFGHRYPLYVFRRTCGLVAPLSGQGFAGSGHPNPPLPLCSTTPIEPRSAGPFSAHKSGE